MSEYNVIDNTELVELIERGLRKGYWDKTLIPELKKRFKEIKKQERLLELYKKLATVRYDMLSCCDGDDDLYDMRDIEVYLERLIKELENES